MKELLFIDIIDTDGRKSHLSAYGREDCGFLRVGGNLEHGALIRPAEQADAMALLKWIQEKYGVVTMLERERDAYRECARKLITSCRYGIKSEEDWIRSGATTAVDDFNRINATWIAPGPAPKGGA